MIYLKLFYSYLKIGFFGFGGGYAMLPLIQDEIVVRNAWITNEQFVDIVAISQTTPGPIAINSATFVGYTVTGNIWGALIATLAVCMPSMTIMILATKYYLKLRGNRFVSAAMSGMQPLVLGMMGAAALLLMTPQTFVDYKSWLIFGACLVLSFKKVNPILLILGAGCTGWLLYGL